MTITWKEAAYEYLLKQDYLAVANYYEEALETEPDNYDYHWYLGLAYLLQEQEEEAQTTWLFAMTQGIEEADELIQELVNILLTEVQRQESLGDYQKSWLIRGHIREIAPGLINNLLKLIQLEINLKIFTPEKLNDWQVIELLQKSPKSSVDSDLLLEVLKKVLEFSAAETVAFARVSLAYISSPETFIEAVVPIVVRMAKQEGRVYLAVDIYKLCLELQPNNLDLLNKQLYFYSILQNFKQALEIAHQYYQNCDTLQKKVFGNYQILYTLILSGAWQETKSIAERHRELLKEIIQQQPDTLEPTVSSCLVCVTNPWLYLQDNLVENRWFQNQISLLFNKSLSARFPALTDRSDYDVNNSSLIKQNKQLRIGYIAHTFRKHSVGWLARWLFHYHNRENFQTVIYLGSQLEDEITEIWYKQKADLVRNFHEDIWETARQIKEDEIDILVDLDSLTTNITCQIMALKPAPVQVTWLGFDASGLPTIDYFIADPYVLPENAQAHYTEKLWRLPDTYLAVDGFEVGIPTLRRDDLGIPHDAVIYLSSHGGYKRHPATIRLQMQIIKEVANSYLLIKGIGDEKSVKQLFSQIAAEEEVDLERLKFLPKDPNEYMHRANLQIADIALDTYPYNGATTTLEILWTGIPLVTRVGEQFAARNSYTFLRNVGVEEGIAWTDEEYLDWGIRLGKDKALREEVAWKLKKSKQTAPLWNGKQFALEMEQAYQQMWSNHINSL